MSLASDLLEKMKQKGQLKIKSEPLPSPPKEGNLLERGRPSTGHDGGPEAPGQPRQAPVVDPVKGDHAETETPSPLFSESEGQSQDQVITPQTPRLGDVPSEDEAQVAPSITQTGGEAKKAKMAPVKIFSKLFNEEIWLVADQEEMELLVSRGIKEAIYMAWEIPVLRGKDKESLKAVHATKKVFPGSALA
jgi:hypothetical protein